MFDENGKLLQLYFDITAGNLFDEGDNPHFRDMYLDIVMNPDGELCVLDETELAEALDRSKITPSEYTQTKQACEALQQLLLQHTDKVLAHCKAAYTRLMKLSSTNQGGF
jgi:predicted RNA-binding protein associated with RNAse of E/G family